MASYQPHQQQSTRRADPRFNVASFDSSWIVTELAKATNQNVFSDTLSSSVSESRHSPLPESEHSGEELHGLPTSQIRFPTHDGRGGFTLALSSHVTSQPRSSRASPHATILQSPSLITPSAKALSSHASTSSSILDDALPRQPHPSADMSQRILVWAQEQQVYTQLRRKRRRLSVMEQRIPRKGLEGWLWRFVSSLIGMDDHLLQIVLGERLVETSEKTLSDGSSSLWETFLQGTSLEKNLASPFPSPVLLQYFRHDHTEVTLPAPTSAPSRPARPGRQAPAPWDPPVRQAPLQRPHSSWSSIPPDPIQTAPFQPTPIHLLQSPDSSHAPWGIEDNDVLSTTTTTATAELPDDYWDREFTIPIVWHLVKNFISARFPLGRHTTEDHVQRSCKEESVHSRWDEPEERYYWHESIDGASSLGLGLGTGHWAEV